MPVRWLQTDPRQREIHRLLQQLVGGEPAAFFLDACRPMRDLRATVSGSPVSGVVASRRV
jgi:hypothetical protein